MKRLVSVLATGYVLMFFSEFVFYGELKPVSDSAVRNVLDLLVMYAVYSAMGYLLLVVCRMFRVRRWPALFLAGALYGMLLEGVVVSTMYEEFPFQIHFTSLTWHAPLDVVAGWYLVQRVIRERSLQRVIWIAVGLGVFWGFWAVWPWWEQGTPLLPGHFARFAWITTAVLVLAYWLLGRGNLAAFTPMRSVTWLLAGVLVFLFGLSVLPHYPFALALLPVLLAAIYLALRKNAGLELAPDVLCSLEESPRLANLLAVLIMPAVASLSYALYFTLGWRMPSNIVVYVLSSVLGVGLFIASFVRLFGRGVHIASV